jgi:hypothetical protein
MRDKRETSPEGDRGEARNVEDWDGSSSAAAEISPEGDGGGVGAGSSSAATDTCAHAVWVASTGLAIWAVRVFLSAVRRALRNGMQSSDTMLKVVLQTRRPTLGSGPRKKSTLLQPDV